MKSKLLIGLLAAPLIFGLAMPSYAKKKTEPVTCDDGSTSTAKGRGACSGHGGVKKDAAAPAAAAAPVAPAAAAAPAAKAAPAATASSSNAQGATAKCKDGSFSHSASHKGACSRHGGVGEWLKEAK
jgi:Protein of unknown function (DUF3761)